MKKLLSIPYIFGLVQLVLIQLYIFDVIQSFTLAILPLIVLVGLFMLAWIVGTIMVFRNEKKAKKS